MMDRSAVVCREPPDGPKMVIASAGEARRAPVRITDGTRRVPATMAAGPARVALMAALLAGAGCRGNYPPTVPVRGRVTFHGGAWPDEGTIYFLPEKPAEGHTHHPGMASFGPDGSFRVRTFTAGDGLAPGTYVVRIECWKVPPTMGGPPAESYLPPDYYTGKRSLPKLVVEPGARRVWFEYDVSAGAGVDESAAAAPLRWPAARHVPRTPGTTAPRAARGQTPCLAGSVRPAVGPLTFCAKLSGGSAVCARPATKPEFPTTAHIFRRRT